MLISIRKRSENTIALSCERGMSSALHVAYLHLNGLMQRVECRALQSSRELRGYDVASRSGKCGNNQVHSRDIKTKST